MYNFVTYPQEKLSTAYDRFYKQTIPELLNGFMECLLCGKGRKVCPRLHVEDENASDANDAEAPTLKDLIAANDVRVLPVTMQALCGAGKSSNFAEALSARWAKKNAEDADWEDGVGEGVFHQGDWSISRETRLT